MTRLIGPSAKTMALTCRALNWDLWAWPDGQDGGGTRVRGPTAFRAPSIHTGTEFRTTESHWACARAWGSNDDEQEIKPGVGVRLIRGMQAER